MQAFAPSQFSPRPAIVDDFYLSGQRHVSDTSISIQDMAFHQKRCGEAQIRELIYQCRERYCFAHKLLRPHALLPDRLFNRDILDVSEFALPWSAFCSAYRRLFFDAQMSLLEDQSTRELRRWGTFLEKECFSRFTREPDHVRAVLETANLIPSRAPTRKIFVGDLFDDIIQDIEERKGHHEYDQT